MCSSLEPWRGLGFPEEKSTAVPPRLSALRQFWDPGLRVPECFSGAGTKGFIPTLVQSQAGAPQLQG